MKPPERSRFSRYGFVLQNCKLFLQESPTIIFCEENIDQQHSNAALRCDGSSHSGTASSFPAPVRDFLSAWVKVWGGVEVILSIPKKVATKIFFSVYESQYAFLSTQLEKWYTTQIRHV